jgi:hypothetical protein
MIRVPPSNPAFQFPYTLNCDPREGTLQYSSNLLPQNSRDLLVTGGLLHLDSCSRILAPLRRGSLFLPGSRGALASGAHPGCIRLGFGAIVRPQGIRTWQDGQVHPQRTRHLHQVHHARPALGGMGCDVANPRKK